MSEEIKGGEPAFPVPDSTQHCFSGEIAYASQGMSLREYYAGQALAGLMAAQASKVYPWRDGDKWEKNSAKVCVNIADALIAELQKGGAK